MAPAGAKMAAQQAHHPASPQDTEHTESIQSLALSCKQLEDGDGTFSVLSSPHTWRGLWGHQDPLLTSTKAKGRQTSGVIGTLPLPGRGP